MIDIEPGQIHTRVPPTAAGSSQPPFCRKWAEGFIFARISSATGKAQSL